MLADREGAGAVFDLAVAPAKRPGLLATVKDLSRGRQSPPAVLDWTGLDVSGDLPGFTTFAPPPSADGAAGLAYFDDSVEIVVTTAERDLAEATRVAVTAVVVCERVGADLRVVDVHRVGDGAHSAAGAWPSKEGNASAVRPPTRATAGLQPGVTTAHEVSGPTNSSTSRS